MASIIQIRRDTATNWTSANPTLANGELGLETDTGKLKTGDGSTVWTSLAYYTLGTVGFLATAGGTMSGALNLADNDLQRPVLKDYAETKVAMAANDVDLALGNVQTKTISGATTLTFSNPPASGSSGSFTLILTNGGSATVTWPTSVDWPAATAPTLTAAGVDVLVFTTIDGGTTWYGLSAGLAMA